MIVTLDGQRLTDDFAPQSTLQALIDRVRAAHLNDRLVVSVAVNGQCLGDAELNASLGQPLDAGVQIDLESGQRDALVRDALRGLAMEFADARARLPDVADQLSSGDVTAAMHDVSEFVALWQTCYRALSQCSGLLNRDLTSLQHNGRNVRAYLEDLIGKLSELRSALEAHDTVMLADLVHYEFPALTETWQAVLNDLAEQVTPATATA